MGEQWHELKANEDLYPNLEYMPSKSAHPREDHKPMYGIIRPINDKFWDKFYPPNGWGCLCGVRSTDKDPTDEYADIPDPTKPFNMNVGKEAKIFDDTHPHFPKDIKGSETYKTVSVWLNKIQRDVIKKDKSIRKNYKLDYFEFTLSATNVKSVLSKEHRNILLRNEILINLDELLPQAQFIRTAPEVKGDTTTVKWLYYLLQYKGEDFYLNIEEKMDGKYIFQYITDSIKKE